MKVNTTRVDARNVLAAVRNNARSRMRVVSSTGLTLLLVLLLVSQAGAQEEYVFVSFKLRVNGDVPAGTIFSVGFQRLPAPRGGSSPNPYFFCGIDPTPGAVAGPATCEGGAEYSYDTSGLRGSDISYSFVHSAPGQTPSENDVFLDDVTTLKGDTTITAYYSFPGGGDADGEEQGEDEMPSQLPATGAGGIQAP